MKKILAIVMAVAMVMALSVTSFAAETEATLSLDNLGYYGGTENTGVTEVDGGLNCSGAQFDVNLPVTVEAGETITVHIKGTSDGDFRVWLIEGAATASNQVYSTDLGFTGGEFDYTFDLTFEDHDSNGITSASAISFKGIAYGTNLDNFTITYVAVVTDGEEAVASTDDADEASEEVADSADSTDASSTETTTSTNANTGVVLAVLPMAVAAAAVVASKKR